jgi:hypothetical protein
VYLKVAAHFEDDKTGKFGEMKIAANIALLSTVHLTYILGQELTV